MQLRYWNFMVQTKAWIYYLDVHADYSYTWEKRINIFLAITSSSSIAAWAVWNEYDIIWAFLIAVSQIITVIKPQLSFAKRLGYVGKFINELQHLFNKMEYRWYEVSEGKLKEEEINELLFGYKSEYTDLERKYLSVDTLPENMGFRCVADKKTEEYFSNKY